MRAHGVAARAVLAALPWALLTFGYWRRSARRLLDFAFGAVFSNAKVAASPCMRPESSMILNAVVRVLPVTREWAEALAEGDNAFGERFGVGVEAGWLGFPEALPIILEAARRDRPDPWGPHLFFAEDDGALVGNGGWKGAPVDGEAELGYAVAPSRQRRGIATAVVRELVGRARNAGLRTVVAHTLAEESASTHVLTKCGFVRVAESVDPVDGRIWRWELSLNVVSAARL
jgi:RimJ/RimL family protein N-acetyltransferase